MLFSLGYLYQGKTVSPFYRHDEVAEWLRRWTANPMGSARVGSNPILVVHFGMTKFFECFTFLHANKVPKRNSVTGNRTRACWVRASYPNH